MQSPLSSNKLTMLWLLFAIWVITIILTFWLNRDCGILGIVSGVFSTALVWVYKIRKDEKINGVNGERDGQGKV